MAQSNLRRLTLALMAVVLAVAACGGTSTPAPAQADAEKATCSALQAFNDELNYLKNMDPTTSTIEDVVQQQQSIATAWSAVESAMATLNASDKQAMENAAASFQANKGTYSAGMTVADAKTQFQTAVAPLKTSYQEMANGLNCKLVTPYE